MIVTETNQKHLFRHNLTNFVTKSCHTIFSFRHPPVHRDFKTERNALYAGDGGITEVARRARARRKFVEAGKSSPKGAPPAADPRIGRL
ncbi:MAG: hypothetical protein LBU64_08880 [Planctomycetota bacterium]|nr:hypothetical protein [Planctomycetota bacterium]